MKNIPILTKEIFWQWVNNTRAGLCTPLESHRFILNPEMAEWLLLNQVKNRKPSKNVDEMSRLHLLGLFPQTHDQVMGINPAGNMNDGQHRCLMVIRLDKPLATLIAFGVPDEEFENIDIGAARTSKDMASLLDLKNESIVASIARQLLLLEQERIVGNGKVSNKEITTFMEANRAALESSAFLARKVRFQATPFGVVHFVFSKVDKAKADAFMEDLAAGVNLAPGSPCLLMRLRFSIKAPHISSRDRIACCFAAANAYFLDDEMRSLRFPKDESRFKVSDEVISLYKLRQEMPQYSEKGVHCEN